jgi:hypothetical protein
MKFKLLKYVNNIFLGGGGSSAIVSVGVFYVWPKTTRLLTMRPREAKRLDTPDVEQLQNFMHHRQNPSDSTFPIHQLSFTARRRRMQTLTSSRGAAREAETKSPILYLLRSKSKKNNCSE